MVIHSPLCHNMPSSQEPKQTPLPAKTPKTQYYCLQQWRTLGCSAHACVFSVLCWPQGKSFGGCLIISYHFFLSLARLVGTSDNHPKLWLSQPGNQHNFHNFYSSLTQENLPWSFGSLVTDFWTKGKPGLMASIKPLKFSLERNIYQSNLLLGIERVFPSNKWWKN